MEFLPVSIEYSQPKVDMTAQGRIGGRGFLARSDSSFTSSDIQVFGALDDDQFVLRGRTKNFFNRNFTVKGSWAGSPMELRCRSKSRRYLIDGHVGDETIGFRVHRSLSDELNVQPLANTDAGFSLKLRNTFGIVLDGEVQDFRTGGVFAAFVPCLVRNLYGSIDSFPGRSMD